MDLIKIIQELRDERKRLDQIITSLEQLQAAAAAPPKSFESRRGRRFMDAEARLEVSRRMKKYWENRRKDKDSEPADSATP